MDKVNSIIKVEGMSCNHCKMSVEKAAKTVDTVVDAVVDLEKKEVLVSFKEAKDGAIDAVKSAISEAGFTPQG